MIGGLEPGEVASVSSKAEVASGDRRTQSSTRCMAVVGCSAVEKVDRVL